MEREAERVRDKRGGQEGEIVKKMARKTLRSQAEGKQVCKEVIFKPLWWWLR